MSGLMRSALSRARSPSSALYRLVKPAFDWMTLIMSRISLWSSTSQIVEDRIASRISDSFPGERERADDSGLAEGSIPEIFIGLLWRFYEFRIAGILRPSIFDKNHLIELAKREHSFDLSLRAPQNKGPVAFPGFFACKQEHSEAGGINRYELVQFKNAFVLPALICSVDNLPKCRLIGEGEVFAKGNYELIVDNIRFLLHGEIQCFLLGHMRGMSE